MKTLKTETFDITPSWQTAMSIHFSALRCAKPKAREQIMKNLESEVMRLAKAVDDHQANSAN